LKIDPENLAIGGVSAGGHLSAVLAQRCLAKQIPIKLQILSVPATDFTACNDDWSVPPDCPYNSYIENVSVPCLPLERMQFFWKHLLGDKNPHLPPAADPAILPPEVELSPIKAKSLKGLAPALVTTSDVDVLRDEGEAYARRLAAEGVPVKLKRYMGVPHIFLIMDGVLPEAREYIQRCCDELKSVFGI
jgi:acetyl esterase/lipase